MKKEADKLKCKNCKYKTNIANTSETGSAICSYPSSWFPVNIEDNCHFIPEKKEITCSDCSRLHEDMACFSCTEDDSAIFNGQLCRGFIDKRKEEIGKILLDEIIIDLTKNKVAISKDFLEKLRRTYAAIDNKMNMRCKYEEFLEYGENEK